MLNVNLVVKPSLHSVFVDQWIPPQMATRRIPSFASHRQLSLSSRASSFLQPSPPIPLPPPNDEPNSGYVEVVRSTGYLVVLRRKIARLVKSEYFERFMLLFIIVNCVLLGFESNHPAFQETRLGRALHVLEFAFLSLFSFEMTMKILAFGFLLAPGSYLRDGTHHYVQARGQHSFQVGMCSTLQSLSLVGWLSRLQ